MEEVRENRDGLAEVHCSLDGQVAVRGRIPVVEDHDVLEEGDHTGLENQEAAVHGTLGSLEAPLEDRVRG